MESRYRMSWAVDTQVMCGTGLPQVSVSPLGNSGSLCSLPGVPEGLHEPYMMRIGLRQGIF